MSQEYSLLRGAVIRERTVALADYITAAIESGNGARLDTAGRVYNGMTPVERVLVFRHLQRKMDHEAQ